MRKILKNIFVVLLFVFLYAPIIMLIVFSFNESTSFSKWTGFSLKWYGELFKNRTVMPALVNTLTIALISAVVSTVVGTISAFGIHHLGKKMKSVMLSVNNLCVSYGAVEAIRDISFEIKNQAYHSLAIWQCLFWALVYFPIN